MFFFSPSNRSILEWTGTLKKVKVGSSISKEAFLMPSSACFKKVLSLQQSFSSKEHFLKEVSELSLILSLQGFALPKNAISTNWLQQKCISTEKEEVAYSTVAASIMDTILLIRCRIWTDSKFSAVRAWVFCIP